MKETEREFYSLFRDRKLMEYPSFSEEEEREVFNKLRTVVKELGEKIKENPYFEEAIGKIFKKRPGRRIRFENIDELELYYFYKIIDYILDKTGDKEILELRKKCEEIVEEIIKAHIKLVMEIALKIWSHEKIKNLSDLEDMVQEGIIGLSRAILRYKLEHPSRAKFSTYAIFWIKQAIIRYLEGNNIIKIPLGTKLLLNRIRRFIEKYQTLYNGEFPDEDIIKQECKISENEWLKVKPLIGAEFESLDRSIKIIEVDGRKRQKTLLETIPDERRLQDKDIEEKLTKEELYRVLQKVLDERELFIIINRFGLGDKEPKTLAEIGDALNLSRERVRQIELRAIKKLRNALRLQEFLKE